MLDSILAGPILRRTTRHRICVWLALDNQKDLTLDILDMSENVIGTTKPEQLEINRVQLGKQLHIYLLQAYPKNIDTFPCDTPLYYRLSSLSESGKPEPLDLQAINLTYLNHKHPIFQVPDNITSLLHGSCRKPHGDKDTDSLTAGDDLLECFYSGKASYRPDLLLFTGDQIYADDVAPSLLAMLRNQAVELTGKNEALPLKEYYDPDYYSPGNSIDLNKLPLGSRMAELKNQHVGLTSTEAYNHLLGFGEFAAMYVYVFGNARNWKTPSTWQEIESSHVPLNKLIKWWEHFGKCGFKSTAKLIDSKLSGIKDDIEAVDSFSKSLFKVRRLLANIPTYMILDDHDVTDDWNITGHWYASVRSSPPGRRMVANALSAYWAFQGWGNNPDTFDNELIDVLKRHLNQTDPDPDGEMLYDLLTWKHRGWGFSVPSNPPIIAIDSRTQRQSDNAFYPARLVDRYALDWLNLEWNKLKTSNSLASDSAGVNFKSTSPIFIAATPVFGFSPLEHFVRLIIWLVTFVEGFKIFVILEKLLNIKGILSETLIDWLDAEAWTANLDGFTDFLDTIVHKMDIEECVFLSGDVHYSFSATGEYSSSLQTKTKQTLHCYQLTSSSLRNKPSTTQSDALEDLVKYDTRKNFWQKFKRWLYSLQFLRRWQVEHKLLGNKITNNNTKDDFIFTRPNLGEVKFTNGKATQHILWYPGSSGSNILKSTQFSLQNNEQH